MLAWFNTGVANAKIEASSSAWLGLGYRRGRAGDFLDGKPIILTAGAMQKIVDPQGNGNEFPKQVAEFKKDFSDKYQKLFENSGWIVEKGIMYYKEFSEAEKITGRPLADIIRKNCNKDNVKKPVRCKPLEAIAKAIIDSDFQTKQVQDFIVRLNNVMSKTPTGANKKDYEKYKIKDFLKSKLGRATALDHDINRPAHVAYYFGEALDRFFAKKDQEIDEKNGNIVDVTQKLSKVSRVPNEWGDNHSSYETELLEIYGALRGEKLTSLGAPKGSPMTNALNRYSDLKKRL